MWCDTSQTGTRPVYKHLKMVYYINMENKQTMKNFTKQLDQAYFEVQALAIKHNWSVDRVMAEEDLRFDPIYDAAEAAGVDLDEVK